MFSKYSVSFNSRHSLNEAYKLIEELSTNKMAIAGYGFSIEAASLDTVAAKATLRSSTSQLVNTHSFTPLINISVWENESGTAFLIEFEINSSVKHFMTIYDLACVFFQIILLGAWIGNEGFEFHYLMPILMMIGFHYLSPPFYDSSVAELKRALYTYFTNEDAELAPKLIKSTSNSSE